MPEQLNNLAAVEHGPIAAFLAADPGEIADVQIYSARPAPPTAGHGGTARRLQGVHQPRPLKTQLRPAGSVRRGAAGLVSRSLWGAPGWRQ